MRQGATGDRDTAAEELAARLGGLPSQTVPGFDNREFDAVSAEFIAQTTASKSAVFRPGNFLTSSRKARTCIDRNALRLEADYVIVPEEASL